MGLHLAGFDVTGVDIEAQPRYPFRFVRFDACAFDPFGYDMVWASPPCQRFTILRKMGHVRPTDNMIPIIRDKLVSARVPYIIENVPGAPLMNSVMLCGSMFGLGVRRHRIFETSRWVQQPICSHASQKRVVRVHGNTGGSSSRDNIQFGTIDEWKAAMGIDWMNSDGLSQAIPPAYSNFLVRVMLNLSGIGEKLPCFRK